MKYFNHRIEERIYDVEHFPMQEPYLERWELYEKGTDKCVAVVYDQRCLYR